MQPHDKFTKPEDAVALAVLVNRSRNATEPMSRKR